MAMGSIKATAIKTLTADILSKNRGNFSNNFEENKKGLGEVIQIRSKKIRNIVAGYITHLIKNEKKSHPKYRPKQDVQDTRRKRGQKR